VTVTETFLSIEVADMRRARTFYVASMDAEIVFASSSWTSLRIAGVRLGLFLHPPHEGGRVGLHFVVTDLAAALREVERSGGRLVKPAAEVAPGVVVADVEDTEGNVFTLRRA